MPGEFGLWSTVNGRFRAWRDAGVCTALLEGVIAEAARQRKTDLSLVSASSTTARAHHDAAGMRIGEEVMDALEDVAADQEQARQKGRPAGTERTGPERRPRAGSAAAHQAMAQAPEAGTDGRRSATSFSCWLCRQPGGLPSRL